MYDGQGRLVKASQKVVASTQVPRVPADPARCTVPPTHQGRTLSGCWLYGGTFANVFGHFITETLTTLWPRREELGGVQGLVFHGNSRVSKVVGWHRRFFALAGYGNLPVHVVGPDAGWHVEELLVPARTLALHAWARPEARGVWDRIATPFRDATGPELVYISRTAVNRRRLMRGRRPPRSDAGRDVALDEVFAQHGFLVFRPELVPVHEQLATVSGARCLAGQSGSGLHQSGFLAQGRRVVEVGDARTGDFPVPMQVAIDAASQHERVFLRASVTPDEIGAALTSLGL